MRLIDADELLKRINVITEDDTCPLYIAAEIEQEIEHSIIVDAVPVVHGRWYRTVDDWYRCYNCKQDAPIIPQRKGDPITVLTNYCPNCGAEMWGWFGREKKRGD